MKAINDLLSEVVVPTFTEALITAGGVGLNGAAGQGQARYYNDMGLSWAISDEAWNY